MIRRIKLVITSRSEGARARSVKTINTFREFTKSFGSPGAEIDMSIFGTTGSAPNIVDEKSMINANALYIIILRF